MLDEPLQSLPGIGRVTAERLAARGFSTVGELLWLLPRRYEDQRAVTPIGSLEPGSRAVTSGVVSAVRSVPANKRRLEVSLEPLSEHPRGRYGMLRLVWFRVPRGMQSRFSRGDRVRAAGRVDEYRGVLSMAHPEVASLGEDQDAEAPGVVPRYPEVPGVAPRTLAQAVRAAAQRASAVVPERIPRALREAEGLPSLGDALRALHLPPPTMDEAELSAWCEGRGAPHRRLALEELFLLELALARRRSEERVQRAIPLDAPQDAARQAWSALPFSPTRAQSRATDEIVADLRRAQPMRRLLQGDVGSGKTAVAAVLAAHAAASGAQVAFLAPTEILAEQHHRNLAPLAEALGLRAARLLGSTPAPERERVLAQLASGETDVVVGTHALLSEHVRLRRLGLAIVDEQHRFGVAQRLQLVGKGGAGVPHLLVMTATPIPRSLALVVYGDLDASVLDELPPGRTPPVTRAYEESQREEALRQLSRALDAGGRAFVVVPAVEPSEEAELPGIVEIHERLVRRFGAEDVVVAHGQLPAAERQRAMQRFAAGESRVLVATTVIEVGIDVPEANVILVERAERFGLAQLHQLRGRVGRAGQRSACLLVHRAETQDAQERLRVLCESGDGFRIAEEDLRLRGPGEIFGQRQAGLGAFRFGDLRRDLPLLERARQAACEVLE
ncbi:MAG: ATP-dependent DNA helicase RecG, partial [Polyangiales bacterium]